MSKLLRIGLVLVILAAGLTACGPTEEPPPGPADLHRWFVRERHMLVLNRSRARAAGVEYARLADLAAAHLAAQPGIARIWRRAAAGNLASGGMSGMRWIPSRM